MQRKITSSQISPLTGPRRQNLDDRPRDIQHSASNVLLDVLAYPIHRYGLITRTSSKGRTSGTQQIIRHNQRVNPTKSLWEGGQLLQSRYHNNRSFGWVVLATTSTLPVIKGPILQFLGNVPNHHICLRFRSGWCQDIPDSSSLGRKMEVCNTNRRDDVARFSGNERRQQAPKHELVLLQTCEHVVPDKHAHMVVLQ